MNAMKLLWALLGTLAMGLQGALLDNSMSVEDWVTTAAALLAAVGTWLVPNTPALAAAKTWVNAFVLGAGALLPLLPGGVSGQEWWAVVIAVMTAAGVYAIPNKSSAD